MNSLPAEPDCPVSPRHQSRNIAIFAINTALVYLAAPVLYVGQTQAAQLQRMGCSDTVCNLPQSFYFYATPIVVLITWFFCRSWQLKPLLLTCYAIVVSLGALVTMTLLVPTPAPVGAAITASVDVVESLVGSLKFLNIAPGTFRIPPDWFVIALLTHSALLGLAFGVRSVCDWELLGRCVASSRRGQALAWAFGVGPLLAFFSAGATQAVLTGEFQLGPYSLVKFAPLPFPQNFAILYGLTVPIMGLSGLLTCFLVVPPAQIETPRPPFFRGIVWGFVEFLSHSPALLAAIALVTMGMGYAILNNITLFTKEAVGINPDQMVGYQQMWRFGCKALAGLLIGGLLSRTSARVGMLVTACMGCASVCWILLASVPAGRQIWELLGLQTAFLCSFGMMGIGELYGVYFANYLLNCSPKDKIRRNQAYVYMLTMPAGLAATIYGQIADQAGLKASFWVAAGILVGTILLILIALPKHPRPPAE